MASKSKKREIAVLGAGAWGTTLAWMLARQGHQVTLWARRPELAEVIRQTRRNEAYRPEVRLPDDLQVTAELAEALEGKGYVVVAVPAQALRQVLKRAASFVAEDARVLLAAKGIEQSTGLRISQVAGEVLGRDEGQGLAVLSGPNLSEEIARGKPAAAVVASSDSPSAQEYQEILASALFRVYTNCDIIGVELCGAFKNVLALAAGISDGLGYGSNAKAALISRGLLEMARVVVEGGGRRVTCWGLAGVGDLITTCHSSLSRNWAVGHALGSGKTVEEAQRQVRGVAEGLWTVAAVVERKGRVELPIAEVVYSVVYRAEPPAQAAHRLMTRRWRDETEAWSEIGPGPTL